MPLPLLPTSLVGSYAAAGLADRPQEARRPLSAARARARNCGASRRNGSTQAQDDATLLAIRDQERAGLDIITDGEMRRESYSNRFATALEGVDIDNPGTALDRSGHPNPVPRVAGKMRRKHPVEVRDVEVPARQHRPHDQDHRAGPVHHVAAGAERFLQGRGGDGARLRGGGQRRDQGPVRGRRRHRADRRALHAGAAGEGAASTGSRRSTPRSTASTARPRCTSASAMPPSSTCGRRAIRSCRSSRTRRCSRCRSRPRSPKLDCSVLEKLPGKTIILGVLDLSDMTIETPETVAARIRRALPYVPAERIVVAPDCGMKYLPREVAFGKMCAMVEGAEDRARGTTRQIAAGRLEPTPQYPHNRANNKDGTVQSPAESGANAHRED